LNVTEAIKARKSVRSYLDKPVENEKVTLILEAARLAPSAFNKQRWRFVVVRDKQTKAELTQIAQVPLFAGLAPVIIVACANADSCVMHYGQPCYPIDVAISLDHIMLSALEYDLGTCWVSMFDEIKVREILGIPEEIRVIALLSLGYPADPSGVDKRRLPLEQIVKYEKW
jgi:nitroreductase